MVGINIIFFRDFVLAIPAQSVYIFFSPTSSFSFIYACSKIQAL